MLCQHSTNFPNIAQEKSWANIKYKIVWNNKTTLNPFYKLY